MRHVLRLPLLTVLAAVWCGSASAQGHSGSPPGQDCQLRIESASTNWIIRGYDPFSGNEPAGSFDVLFVNDGNHDCRFYPVFQSDLSSFGLRSSDGTSVPYTLIDETDGYDATPLGGRTVRRVNNPQVVVPSRSQQSVRYILSVDSGRLPGDGLFNQTLLLQAERPNGEILAQRQMAVGIDVLPSAVMSLAGAFTRVDGRADVDLGALREGVANVPLNLNVQSTRAFELSVESQNNGKLRLAGTEWSVPYQLLIDGRIAPNSTHAYASDSRPGRRSATLPIGFLIGDAGQKRAGTYSDVVAISISVN